MFWLGRLVFVSAVASIFAVKTYDLLGVNDAVSRIARPGIAVGAWAAVTTGMGVSAFKSKVRSLKRRTTGVLKALTR